MHQMVARIALATALGIGLSVSAYAQFNGCAPGFCPSILGGGGPVTPQPKGKILLVDGVSFVLQTDAASKLCRAGGC